MSPSPRIFKNDTSGIYFLTLTVIEWIDIFTKPLYFRLLKDSLLYCINKKGLVLYEYVFMSNHIHLIVSAKDYSSGLDCVIRDFKRYTTNKLRIILADEKRSYIISLINNSYKRKKGTQFQVWQRGNYAEYISSKKFMTQKTIYIWNNPVKKDYVLYPEDWLYSSARQKILNLHPSHPDVVLPCINC